MKRLLSAVFACVLAAFMVGQTAQAWDTIDEVVAALQQSPVYVAPTAPGTNSDTSGVLQSLMHNGDNLIIVMLPAGTADSAADLASYARQLDQATGGAFIIGLSSGNQYLAYSAILPAGQAAELMARASTVATNPVEAMQTFITNVHNWQLRNPKAEASQPPKKGDSGSPVGPILGGGLFLAIAVVGAAVYRKVRRKPAANGPLEDVRLRSAPDPVRDVLHDIMTIRPRIHDADLQATLTQIAKDTEAYFARNSANQRDADETEEFRVHLANIKNVLDRYVDIQNNPRYYDMPSTLLLSGKDAVNGFAEFALASVKRGGKRQLTAYNVDTDILTATRFK